MMASPSEYRDLLWNALYVGELSPEQKAKQAEGVAAEAKRSGGKGRKAGKMPKGAYDEMEQMMAQARALRGEPDEPEPPAEG